MAKSPVIKRAIKLLAVCRDPRVRSAILARGPDQVIKTICNAALNIERGDIHLDKKKRSVFAKHRAHISKLTSKKLSVGQKRKFLNQKGGIWPILPVLLSTALGALGSALFT